MKLAVGIPTFMEASTIRQCVQSVLDSGIDEVNIIVSDRSPNGESSVAIPDLLALPNVMFRSSGAALGLINFCEAGEELLALHPRAEGYALLAGDDWWSGGLGEKCLTILQTTCSDAVLPSFTWTSVNAEAFTTTRLNLSSPKYMRRLLSVLVRGVEHTQPANLIYAVYGRLAFEQLIRELRFIQKSTQHAMDVSLAFRMIQKFQFEDGSGAVVYRRASSGVDYASSRLSQSFQNPPNSILTKFFRNRKIAAANIKSIAVVLPPPWNLKICRLMLTAWWNTLSTFQFIVRKIYETVSTGLLNTK